MTNARLRGGRDQQFLPGTREPGSWAILLLGRGRSRHTSWSQRLQIQHGRGNVLGRIMYPNNSEQFIDKESWTHTLTVELVYRSSCSLNIAVL